MMLLLILHITPDSSELLLTSQFNDGVQPTWHLRAESLREKKSWLVRLAHVHAIVRWVC